MRIMVLILGIAATLYGQVALPQFRSVANGASFTYYVDSSRADDTGNGLTPAMAKKTIAAVNALALTPGQSVGFKRGGIWRETLAPGQSGTAGNPIRFGAYGTGPKPRITGAALLSGWATGSLPYQQDAYAALNTPASLNLKYNSSGQQGGSQFIAGSSYSVSQIALQLSKVGSPTGTVTVSIYSDNGSNNVGSLLGSAATLNASALTTSYVVYTLTFGTPVALTAGTKYWIIVNPSTSVSTSNYINCRLDTAGTGHLTARYNGSAWAVTSNQGIYFVAYAIQSYPNVWGATIAITPLTVLFNGASGTPVASASALMASQQWYASGSLLYIYSTSDPGVAYTNPGIEASALANSLTSTASYLTFDGLDLSMGNSYANVIFGNNSGSNITIQNCEIHDSNQTGLYFWGTQNGLAQNNRIYNIWNGGTHLGNGQGNGVAIYGSNALSNRITANLFTGDFRGIFIYGAGSNPLGTLIDHNIVVTPYINGIDQFQVNAASNPTMVYNNTIIHSPFAGTGGQAGHGIDIQDVGSDGWDARNNLIYATYSGTNADVQAVSISSTVALTTINVDYNDYFLAPGSTAQTAQDTSGNRYATLSSWQGFLAGTGYTGKDVHSIAADPLFTNLAGGDYTLQPGSPAIGTGQCIAGVTSCPTNIGAK